MREKKEGKKNIDKLHKLLLLMDGRRSEKIEGKHEEKRKKEKKNADLESLAFCAVVLFWVESGLGCPCPRIIFLVKVKQARARSLARSRN